MTQISGRTLGLAFAAMSFVVAIILAVAGLLGGGSVLLIVAAILALIGVGEALVLPRLLEGRMGRSKSGGF